MPFRLSFFVWTLVAVIGLSVFASAPLFGQ